MPKIKRLAAALASAGALLFAGQASAVPVGLELMLLVDVSGSVDNSEYALQKQGYVQAFQNAAVQNAILASQGGAIAVTYIEWSGSGDISSRVGWTLIDSIASANAFAAAINASTRAFGGSTAIQDAIGNGYLGFGDEVGGAANGFESLRQVIDVSGDGADNDSVLTGSAGRDAALRAGVDTINGIYIAGDVGLAAYYNNNVKGGINSFTVDASTFAEFGTAVERKLVREIGNTVPEPGSIALAGAALLGMGAARRRSKQA
jgi:hypothetical protein